jgi:hypothetical protein
MSKTAKEIALELKKMHYKLIFDVDFGVNAEKDWERAMASIYAAKLTASKVQSVLSNDVMLCKKVVRKLWDDVYQELVILEQLYNKEKF